MVRRKGLGNVQLNIIYQDKDVIVCMKPAGVATQTARFCGQDMVSMLKNYLAKETGEKNPYVGIIHRLDQPVSGLLVFAKNQKAAASLSKQIQDGNANKDYIAFCEGILESKEGTLVHYIMKDSATKLAKVLNESNQQLYKKAILSYGVETEYEDASIIKVHLQTGRFHQIRAQFSHIGHSLLGDTKYGSDTSKEISMRKRIQGIALCAYSLTFLHPATGKEMKIVLDEKYLPEWYQNRFL